jgi:hypothetical protein
VEVEIVPEPDPAERAALLEAVASLDADSEQPPAHGSSWRRAALDLAEDDDLFG